MPQYNKSEIGALAKEYGFVRDTFEKVLRLKEILRFFNEQEVLRDQMMHIVANWGRLRQGFLIQKAKRIATILCWYAIKKTDNILLL